MFDKIESVVEGVDIDTSNVGLAQDMGYSNETILVEAVRLTLSALGKASGALCKATNTVYLELGDGRVNKTHIEVFTQDIHGDGNLMLGLLLYADEDSKVKVSCSSGVMLNTVSYNQYEPKVQVASKTKNITVARGDRKAAKRLVNKNKKIVNVNLYHQIVVRTSDDETVQNIVADYLDGVSIADERFGE